jgi:hypothetical protein
MRGAFAVFVDRVALAAEEAKLSYAVSGGPVEQELAHHWHLDFEVQRGESLEKAEQLVRQILAELAGVQVEDRSLLAARQGYELGDEQRANLLLGRALRLAEWECSPSTCLNAAEQLTPAALRGLSRFDLSRALIVEWRYDPGADDDGSIVRVP